MSFVTPPPAWPSESHAAGMWKQKYLEMKETCDKQAKALQVVGTQHRLVEEENVRLRSVLAALSEKLREEVRKGEEKRRVLPSTVVAPRVGVPERSMFGVSSADSSPPRPQSTELKTAAILAKLTPHNFEHMCDQLTAIPTLITDVTAISRTTKQIFEQAVKHPSSSEVYAELSYRISVLEKQHVSRGSRAIFKRLLVEETQKGFEARKTKESSVRLATIQFVGELFKKDVLTERVIHHIIDVILNGGKNAASDFLPDSGDVEVLCRLLTMTGRLLERALRPDSPFVDTFGKYFKRMGELALQPIYPAPLKQRLLNTINLKVKGWPEASG